MAALGITLVVLLLEHLQLHLVGVYYPKEEILVYREVLDHKAEQDLKELLDHKVEQGLKEDKVWSQLSIKLRFNGGMKD